MSLLLAAVTGQVNYSLTCAAGSYSLTGQAVLLRRGYSLVCAAGSYSIAGQGALLRRGYALTCAAGAYALTGQISVLRRGYSLPCAPGSYALTGQTAALVYMPGATKQHIFWGNNPRKQRDFYRRPPTADEIRAERKRLGIIPVAVAQSVRKVAEQAAQEADADRAVAVYFDRLRALLEAQQEVWRQEYAAELERQKDAAILEAIRAEAILSGLLSAAAAKEAATIEHEQEAEDIAIAILLMDM